MRGPGSPAFPRRATAGGHHSRRRPGRHGRDGAQLHGGAGPAGDTWITVYDTDPDDATPTLFTGSVSLSADVLIHRFNNAMGAGLLALYNEAARNPGSRTLPGPPTPLQSFAIVTTFRRLSTTGAEPGRFGAATNDLV